MPQYQPSKGCASFGATSSSPSYRSPEKTLWQQFKSSPAWKYLLLAGALLTAWAMWRHHQGQTTIYNDYTDAAITAAGCRRGTGLLDELARAASSIAMVAGLTGFMFALMFAVYASVRTNQGWMSISLSLIAKMTLVSVFYAVIGVLVASLFLSTKYKGESQARANARNRTGEERNDGHDLRAHYCLQPLLSASHADGKSSSLFLNA